MSELEREAREALGVLRERRWPVDADRQAERDARIEAALVNRLKQPARSIAPPRRRGLLLLAAFLAAGGAAAAVFALNQPKPVNVAESRVTPEQRIAVTGKVELLGTNGERSKLSSSVFSVPFVGDVATPEDHAARLTAESGLVLDLESASTISVAGLSNHSTRNIELKRGRVTCSVPKLGSEESFSVTTPEARVIVHGTVFSVERQINGAQVNTCVRVESGRVEVRRASDTTFLSAGQDSGCDNTLRETANPNDRPAGESRSPSKGAAAGRHASPVANQEQEAEAMDSAKSSLADQAAALQRALAAERRGRFDEAERELSHLLSQFPETPLRPEAEGALERVRQNK